MITLLLIKDIRLLLKDLKYQVFFLVLIALFILSAISGSVTYKTQTAEYQKLLNEHQNAVHNDTTYNMLYMLSRRDCISVIDTPSPALLFSGFENYHNQLFNGVMLYDPLFQSYGSAGLRAFNLNWYFILGVLSGFIMLIMSFEALSSEKRAGTFRLTTIYGSKRQSVMWSKYISYMLLYLITIVPPALISIILFFALTGTWQLNYMMQFLLIILLSIPFASFFVFLGMFISMAKNYRNAIVMVIFVWLLFVIIIPQSANIFGKLISPIKTTTEYRQLKQDAWNTEIKTWTDKYNEKVMGNGSLADGLRVKAVNASDEKRNLIEQQELAENKRQVKTIKLIASLSPFTQFEAISEIIFDKGFYLQRHLQETMKNTLFQVRNLMIAQDNRDETSLNLFYSGAVGDLGAVSHDGLTTFSKHKFEHPNLLFVTNIQTDDGLSKTLKIILRLLPILSLNLLLIVFSVLKLERLDIR